jgi:hypothetical protein
VRVAVWCSRWNYFIAAPSQSQATQRKSEIFFSTGIRYVRVLHEPRATTRNRAQRQKTSIIVKASIDGVFGRFEQCDATKRNDPGKLGVLKPVRLKPSGRNASARRRPFRLRQFYANLVNPITFSH